VGINEGCKKTVADLIVAGKGSEGYAKLSRAVLQRMLNRRKVAQLNPVDKNPGKAPKRGRKQNPLFEEDIKARLVFEVVKEAQSTVNKSGSTEKGAFSPPPPHYHFLNTHPLFYSLLPSSLPLNTH